LYCENKYKTTHQAMKFNLSIYNRNFQWNLCTNRQSHAYFTTFTDLFFYYRCKSFSELL
jgi:hypothetical protein